MKTITQVIENSHLSSESRKTVTERGTTSTTIKKAREACVYIWPILTGMYGNKFTSQFGESADPTWVACLKNLGEDEIKKGLKESLEYYPNWPPGAAQFRALCKNKQQSGGAYVDFNDPRHPSYESKRIESDEMKENKRKNAKTQLAKIKNILK